MEKLIKILFSLVTVFFLFFGIFQYSYATSGACSSHGGVNCSMGRQASGTVYCNDGWTDSIVQYEFTVMCQNNALDPECVSKTTEVIKARDKYLVEIDKEIQAELAKNTDMSDPASLSISNSQLNYLYALRERQNQSYIKMIEDSCNNYKAPQIQQFDTIPENDETKDVKLSNGLICKGISKDEISCACASDYNWDEDKKLCVIIKKKTNDQKCKDKHGLKSIGNEKTLNCICADGYVWSVDGTICEIDPKNAYDKACKDNDVNSLWNGKLHDLGKPECDCIFGYSREADSNKCVLLKDTKETPAPEIKTEQKGFFSKIWVWLTGLF